MQIFIFMEKLKLVEFLQITIYDFTSNSPTDPINQFIYSKYSHKQR